MDAKFSGPSYTLGVEEELMILDGKTFALANEIDAVVEAYDGKGEGEVKPELLQSVLEIATPPSKDLAEVGEPRAPPAPRGVRGRRLQGASRSAPPARIRPRSGRSSASPPTRATAS